MSQTLSMYQSVGPSAFSNMACQMAPYFGTINPEISVLTPGRGEVKVPFRKEITNHLASVHAIALCNAAELAGGMMTEVSIPSGALDSQRHDRRVLGQGQDLHPCDCRR